MGRVFHTYTQFFYVTLCQNVDKIHCLVIVGIKVRFYNTLAFSVLNSTLEHYCRR